MSEDDIPDGETPGDLDAEEVIERWEEIEERGHPLGPAQYDDERYSDTGTKHPEGDK